MQKLVIAAVMAVSVGPAQAASIVNGSFESSSLASVGQSTRLATGSTQITGWTVDTGNVDYTGTMWNAADGGRSVDLAGNTAGSISQQVTGLITGRVYNVIFDLAANPDGNPAVKVLSVSSGDESSIFTSRRADSSRSNMNWVERVFSFTALSLSQLLTFRSVNNGSFGPVIDDVRLQLAPIPLPATAPLALLGLGGLWFLRRRKQTNA